MTNPWILLGLGLAWAMSLVGVGTWQNDAGHVAERTEWQAKELKRTQAEALAAFKNAENNLRAEQDQDAKNRKVSSEYQTALAATRDYRPAAGGLRVPSTICDDIARPGQAAGAGGSDGAAAGTVLLPAALGRELRVDAKRADEVSDQVRALQKWAVEQGLYGP